jgi:sRNA-binding carbon storage regulator CsrA
MLVVNRKRDERLLIEVGDVVVVVTVIREVGERLKLGIAAPPQCGIWREEIAPAALLAKAGLVPSAGKKP